MGNMFAFLFESKEGLNLAVTEKFILSQLAKLHFRLRKKITFSIRESFSNMGDFNHAKFTISRHKLVNFSIGNGVHTKFTIRVITFCCRSLRKGKTLNLVNQWILFHDNLVKL